jgi:hypothetical protein
LYLLVYHNGMVSFHSKKARVWRLIVTDNKLYSGLHVKCPILCLILTTFGISRQIFIKIPIITFRVCLSSGRRADTRGQDRQTDGRTDGRADGRMQGLTTSYHFCGRELQSVVGLHVKCTIFLLNCNKVWVVSTRVVKVSNIKYHVNPSSRIPADTCGQTDGRTRRGQ